MLPILLWCIVTPFFSFFGEHVSFNPHAPWREDSLGRRERERKKKDDSYLPIFPTKSTEEAWDVREGEREGAFRSAGGYLRPEA